MISIVNPRILLATLTRITATICYYPSSQDFTELSKSMREFTHTWQFEAALFLTQCFHPFRLTQCNYPKLIYIEDDVTTSYRTLNTYAKKTKLKFTTKEIILIF